MKAIEIIEKTTNQIKDYYQKDFIRPHLAVELFYNIIINLLKEMKEQENEH